MSNSLISPELGTSKVKLLTDELSETPLLEFNTYRDVIFDLLINSTPRFSIGIFGEWGTGKSTLMNSIEKKLEEGRKDVLTIWFNAWKYERDNNLAVVSLLKAILFGMYEHNKFKKIRRTIMGTIINLDEGIHDRFGINENKDNLFHNEKNSIFFDGIKKIESDLKEIINHDNDCRVVVFIDDLDRCSPHKAIEIFESIKGFLDVFGIIYILGLSNETISKFFSVIYRDLGINGENYLQKIIQIPILIPIWNQIDIEKLSIALSKEVGSKYSKLLKTIQN